MKNFPIKLWGNFYPFLMKQPILFVFLFLLFSGCAKKTYLNLGETSSKNYVEEIPFEQIKKKIIVSVEIEGETYNFMLDTGAPNVISKEFQEKYQYEKLFSLAVNDANNKSKNADVVLLKSLKIGSLTFENNAAVVLDFEDSKEIWQCLEIDGIIGSNLLRNSILQIDTKRKTLRLSDSEKLLSLDRKKAEKLFLSINQSNPFLWVRLGGENGVREQLLIDTGMSGIYDLSLSNYQQFIAMEKSDMFEKLGEGKGSATLGVFGADEVKNLEKFRLSSLQIDQVEFKNLTTITTYDNNSRIGTDVLDYGIMTIDYKNKRFYFDAYAENQIDLRKEDFGFSPTIENDELIIGVVFREELKDKLKYGDRILAIDKNEINDESICEWMRKDFVDDNPDHIVLKIKASDDEIKEVKVEKRIP